VTGVDKVVPLNFVPADGALKLVDAAQSHMNEKGGVALRQLISDRVPEPPKPAELFDFLPR
jgi:hypothetical protein